MTRHSDGPHLIYKTSDGEHVIDLMADVWYTAPTERPDGNFYHQVSGRDQAILRGLLNLVQEWLDDPGDARK